MSGRGVGGVTSEVECVCVVCVAAAAAVDAVRGSTGPRPCVCLEEEVEE